MIEACDDCGKLIGREDAHWGRLGDVYCWDCLPESAKEHPAPGGPR